MLVLTSKAGESVHAGDLTIRVLSCGRTRVRLGFTAPAELKILRASLLSKEEAREHRALEYVNSVFCWEDVAECAERGIKDQDLVALVHRHGREEGVVIAKMVIDTCRRRVFEHERSYKEATP